MRWMKHLTLAHADKEVDLLLEEHGALAYGIWWLILEDIAAPIENGKYETWATHSLVRWSQICHCSARSFTTVTQKMASLRLISVQTVDNRLRIDVPNIMKYKDEYTKKSGATPDKLPTKADTDREQTQTHTDEPCASDDARAAAAPEKPLPDTGSEMAKPATAEFELQEKSEPPKKRQFPYNADTVFEHEFWPHRWRPEGKSDARSAFKKHAKGRADADRIIASVKEQFPHYGSIDDVSKRPHMSTWINGKRYEDNLAESGKLANAAKHADAMEPWFDQFAGQEAS